jgi:hypothetical protein
MMSVGVEVIYIEKMNEFVGEVVVEISGMQIDVMRKLCLSRDLTSLFK